ncbi:hypothetical protein [Sphingomonas paucimobilis]|uniref:hypothetical protein n=1 Tax=Sphingomonas paucimobilis TaxID=13689 RepID=UPI00069FB6A4|nr:hypothetical protein [Sphingomonas paucimobilis]
MKILLMAGAMALACFSAPIAAQTKPPIAAPSSIVPPAGVAFTGADGQTKFASPADPLPTTAAPLAPAGVTPLVGTSTGAQTVGPFVPVLGRPITVALTATSWPGGQAQLLRSTDGGVTKLPLTPAGVTVGVYSGIGADSPWVETEANATYYLSLPAAGIAYRVAQ